MRDVMGMMKQVQDLQKRMEDTQAELEALEVEGASGGGLVRVTANAKGAVRRVAIDPGLLKPEEAEIVEDLLVAALNDARVKGERLVAERMGALTAGLPLPPGMKLF